MKEVIIVFLFFLATSLFSLYLGMLTFEAIKRGEIEPLFTSPSDYKNALYIFFLILLSTSFILILTKTKIEFIKVIELISSFFLVLTTFSYFFHFLLAVFLTALLILISEVRKSYWIKNLILFLAISSASALVGASLSTQVLLALFAILSIYDIVSVFFTKHMVYLAEKMVSKPSVFISIFPSGKVRTVKFSNRGKKVRIFALGSGDYFLPSSFAISILPFGLMKAVIVLILNSIAILLLFFLLSRLKNTRPLPALPFLFVSSIIGWFLSFYL